MVGVIRAAMSVYGIRGPFADFMFIGVRLLNDQSLENYTGAGALPWTWPVSEQVIDIFGKAVYALVTGWVSGLDSASVFADEIRSVITGCSRHNVATSGLFPNIHDPFNASCVLQCICTISFYHSRYALHAFQSSKRLTLVSMVVNIRNHSPHQDSIYNLSRSSLTSPLTRHSQALGSIGKNHSLILDHRPSRTPISSNNSSI